MVTSTTDFDDENSLKREVGRFLDELTEDDENDEILGWLGDDEDEVYDDDLEDWLEENDMDYIFDVEDDPDGWGIVDHYLEDEE